MAAARIVPEGAGDDPCSSGGSSSVGGVDGNARAAAAAAAAAAAPPHHPAADAPHATASPGLVALLRNLWAQLAAQLPGLGAEAHHAAVSVMVTAAQLVAAACRWPAPAPARAAALGGAGTAAAEARAPAGRPTAALFALSSGGGITGSSSSGGGGEQQQQQQWRFELSSELEDNLLEAARQAGARLDSALDVLSSGLGGGGGGGGGGAQAGDVQQAAETLINEVWAVVDASYMVRAALA